MCSLSLIFNCLFQLNSIMVCALIGRFAGHEIACRGKQTRSQALPWLSSHDIAA